MKDEYIEIENVITVQSTKITRVSKDDFIALYGGDYGMLQRDTERRVAEAICKIYLDCDKVDVKVQNFVRD